MKEFGNIINQDIIAPVSGETQVGEERLKTINYLDTLIRKDVFDMIRAAGAGHFGASYSSTEVLTTLYFGGHFDWRSGTDRDRLILSNGHAVATLYSILSYLGVIDRAELKNFRRHESILNAHPCAYLTPGIESSTGSLGQGLGRGIGMALADKINGVDRYTYIIFGDGEAQEGQMLESASLAPKFGLDNLIAIVDKNRLQLSGPTNVHNQLDDNHMWKVLGWNPITVDGHDHIQLDQALTEAKANCGSPSIIVANTVMGKGLTFMESDSLSGNSRWHHGHPSIDQFELGEIELNYKIEAAREDLNIPPKESDHTATVFGLTKNQLRTLPNHPTHQTGLSTSEVEIVRGDYLPGTELPANTTQAFIDSLIRLSNSNSNIILLCADLAGSKSLGIYKYREAFPDRFIDVGIREQSLANIAGGLASSGIRPVIVVYDAMVNLMAEQIRFISQDKLPVLIWGAVGGTASAMGGRSHQSSYEPVLYSHIPGMAYFEPCDSNETYELLQSALNHCGPSYFRTSRYPNSIVDRGVNPQPEKGAYILGEFGNTTTDSAPDALLIATGSIVRNVIDSAKKLTNLGISSRLINLTRLEEDLLVKNLRPLLIEDVPIVTIHDAQKTILANLVSGIITMRPSLKNELLALGISGWGAINGDNDFIATTKDSGIDTDGIYTSIKSWLERR